MSQKQNNQPQIIVQQNSQSTKQTLGHSKLNNKSQKIIQQGKNIYHKSQLNSIKHIKNKHPDCIPVFFIKHEASQKQFSQPVNPFILFNKQLPIQQAMLNLYNQIKIKGLYFFCLKIDSKTKKFKYVIIKPQRQTIQNVYKKYGNDGYLTLIYGDKNTGMGGINKLQKWLIRILILLVIIWVSLFSYPYIMIYQQGGIDAVINSIRKIETQQIIIQNKKQQQFQINQIQQLNKQIKDYKINEDDSIKIEEIKIQEKQLKLQINTKDAKNAWGQLQINLDQNINVDQNKIQKQILEETNQL